MYYIESENKKQISKYIYGNSKLVYPVNFALVAWVVLVH